MIIKKLILRRAGMFSNVNEVIQNLYLAEQKNYKFIIRWGKSCYKDNKMKGNPWNYYFDDCFNVKIDNVRNAPILKSMSKRNDNIICPRPKGGKALLLPHDRNLVHHYIKKNIKLKPKLSKIINTFKKKHFINNYVIGVHLRGPEKNDGGLGELKRSQQLKNGVAFELYFKNIDKELQKNSDAKIFVCSDSQMVIDECINTYGDKIITYPSSRSYMGAVHHKKTHTKRAIVKEWNKDTNFSSYKLGEDILVESHLLAITDFFICGCSNITNFILCKNPFLKYKYVYEK